MAGPKLPLLSPGAVRRWRAGLLLAAVSCSLLSAAVPVRVEPLVAPRGMVVAAHPEAAAIGAEVLRAGGNAMDAAVAVSLAVGVAEPYGSGLGGKLMLLYHDAKSGRTFAVDGMDQAGWSLDPESYRKLPAEERRYGWKSVCVPGLAAALELAHRRWGARPWADNVRPAADLARRGFTVLPKTRDLFAEREELLRRDAGLTRLYLPGGRLPDAGALLPNEDLARTLDLLAAGGAESFYRGPIAAAIVAATQAGGGFLTREDFARYEARVVEPVSADWRGVRIVGGPPPATGAALVLPILLALEPEEWHGPLRTAENLHRLGRVWQEIQPEVQRGIADVPGARAHLAAMLEPAFITAVRRRAGLETDTQPPAARAAFEPDFEDVHASTTHFIVADAAGNVVCATQSQSLHFGAAVVAPGTGVVLNNTMTNFALFTPDGVNFLAPGKRPRSTITPTIILRGGRPVLALGIPGAQRIPTAVIQVLLDHFSFGRPLGEAIGDTRVHLVSPLGRDDPNNVFEVEASLPPAVEAGLVARGWQVSRREPAGTGRHFGGLNAVAIAADGTKTGYPDPRRTNAAAGH